VSKSKPRIDNGGRIPSLGGAISPWLPNRGMIENATGRNRNEGFLN
jgi:hypothetical protein